LAATHWSSLVVGAELDSLPPVLPLPSLLKEPPEEVAAPDRVVRTDKEVQQQLVVEEVPVSCLPVARRPTELTKEVNRLLETGLVG
jgi:hypothetical protein